MLKRTIRPIKSVFRPMSNYLILKKHVDVSFMRAHGFLKGLIEHAQNLYLQDNLYQGWLTGSMTKIYHPEFIIKEDEIILDTSKIALADMTGLIYPAIWINLTLALEMGWFEEDEDEDDPQFVYKLGPNLSVQLNGYEIPSTTDINNIIFSQQVGCTTCRTFRQILD